MEEEFNEELNKRDNFDYESLFNVQKKLTKILKQVCPNINYKSGIYFYIRVAENEKCAYIGQAVNLIKRNISHLQGYKQRIDISIKKWGLYSTENEIGWKLNVLNCPREKLDNAEKYYIKLYQNAGYEMYNITSGSQGVGKYDINQRKEGRGYRDGLAQGRKSVIEELKHIVDKYLIIKPIKDGVMPNKMLEKFYNILGESNENNNKVVQERDKRES